MLRSNALDVTEQCFIGVWSTAQLGKVQCLCKDGISLFAVLYFFLHKDKKKVGSETSVSELPTLF